MSALFHSRNLSSPFPFFGNGTVCNDEWQTVMGVQGVFPLAHGDNYNVNVRSESVQNHVLNKYGPVGEKGGNK